MPVYKWECNECGAQSEVVLKASEYDDWAKKNEGCPTFYEEDSGCRGTMERVYENYSVAHSWKGGAPTPKFGR
jgi:predicted nucleic acid-binding Zn ribbon protein